MSNINPNLFAYLALFIWPVVALHLYSKLPVGQATLWTILGGYLLLPVDTEIKFQMIPAIDKHSIPNLAAMIGCTFVAGRLPKFFRRFGSPEILLLCIIISPFFTAMLNTDPIRAGGFILRGNELYDAGSAVMGQLIFILPFFIGRQFLRGLEDNTEVLRIMVIAGLIYTLPALFEVRMSPQLHTWLYGYFPGSFATTARDGGFRPVVFLGNGLLVSFFAMTTAVAAAALWRARISIARLAPGGITAYLSFVLVLYKTLSAVVYGAFLVPLVRWASPRLQLGVASVLVTIALTYPLLRIADLVPTKPIVEAAQSVSVDRAGSLQDRFDQEKQLLEHAWQRPWFGWGLWGRNRVFNGYMGTDSSITDGYWIGLFGTFGIVGFVGQFGLLALAVFRAATALKFVSTVREGQFLAALALIVAISVVDLLPNASLSPWTWLLAGTLLGRAENIRAAAREFLHLSKMRLVGDAALTGSSQPVT